MIALNLTFSHGIPEFQFIVAKIHFYSIHTGSSPRSSTCCTVLLFIERGHSISTFVCCCILIIPLIFHLLREFSLGLNPIQYHKQLTPWRSPKHLPKGGGADQRGRNDVPSYILFIWLCLWNVKIWFSWRNHCNFWQCSDIIYLRFLQLINFMIFVGWKKSHGSHVELLHIQQTKIWTTYLFVSVLKY